MKKIFVLLLISMFFVTGCNIKQIDTNNIGKLTDNILNKKLNLYNQISNGYKYYAPRGVTLIDNTDYNEKLFSDGVVYYLYVDVVSYYFKKDFNYEINSKAYISKDLNYHNIKGYLEVTKYKNKNLYFIEMMFNYSKIEAYVTEQDINQTILNASYIMNSMTFNDKIINTLFGENKLTYSEQDFKVFTPKTDESKFINYEKEYGQYEGTIDENLIDQDQTDIPDQTSEDTLNQGGNYETD